MVVRLVRVCDRPACDLVASGGGWRRALDELRGLGGAALLYDDDSAKWGGGYSWCRLPRCDWRAFGERRAPAVAAASSLFAGGRCGCLERAEAL